MLGHDQRQRSPISTTSTVAQINRRWPRLLLVHFLRDAGLTGTKIGCDTSQCGACTGLMEGMAVKACTTLAVQADGASVTTIEGLADNGQLTVLQEASGRRMVCSVASARRAWCSPPTRSCAPIPIHRPGRSVTGSKETYDALDLIDVDYEPLPAVVDPQKAASGAPQLHKDIPGNVAFHWTVAGGDVEAAVSSAGVVVRDRIIQQRLIPTAMETRGAVAPYVPATGELTLWNTTQNPHIVRFIMSVVTGVPRTSIDSTRRSDSSSGRASPACARSAALLAGRAPACRRASGVGDGRRGSPRKSRASAGRAGDTSRRRLERGRPLANEGLRGFHGRGAPACPRAAAEPLVATQPAPHAPVGACPRSAARPLVLIGDVSGSMERYSRVLVHFLYGVAHSGARVEAFLFATRLTRVTRQLTDPRGNLASIEQLAAHLSTLVVGRPPLAVIHDDKRRATSGPYQWKSCITR
jgi:hypothetical protein